MPKGLLNNTHEIVCSLCKVKFIKKTGRNKYCSKKCSERAKYILDKKYYLSNRNGLLINRYGISLEEYNRLKDKQNNVCAICGSPEKQTHSKSGKLWNLSVDHCHKTGKVRGLLCVHCNHLLGAAKDNLLVLKRAVNYLEGVFSDE